MTDGDYEYFNEYLAGVFSVSGNEFTKLLARVWWRMFQKYPLEQFIKAVNMHMADPEQGMFAPKPAHIYKLIEGTKTDNAQVAWGKVLMAMQRIGAYSDVCFDEGIINRVIEDQGGWPKICRTKEQELSFLQTHFCKSYQAYASRGENVFPSKLYGDRSPDHEYTSRGLPLPQTFLIGDEEKCKNVMRLGCSTTSNQIHRLESLVPEKLLLTEKGAA